MSITKIAEKIFDEVSQQIDMDTVTKKQVFVNAFINGLLYGEVIAEDDIEIEIYEEQLDLPIH